MSSGPETWHHGLVGTWWENFNDSFRSHEIDYFREWVEERQPALDADCGAGRLPVPFFEAGLEVDGCDVSIDMPRRYRTIFVVGTFELGSTPCRCWDALHPRGLLGAVACRSPGRSPRSRLPSKEWPARL